MSDVIEADEFEARLEAMCIGGSTGFPRRRRDLHILLASATLWMSPDGVYSEQEVNEGLQSWLRFGCPSLDVDVVTLRRELVDRVYLNRDDSGRFYTAGPGPREIRFGPGVATIDPIRVIEDSVAERDARKRDFLSQKGD